MFLLRHLPAPTRRHLPQELDAQRPSALVDHARLLLAEACDSPAAFQQWLAHRAEFEAAVEEALLLARLEVADQPADPMRRAWLEHLHQDLGATLEDLRHRLDQKVWESPARTALPEDQRPWEGALRRRLELFREHNLAIMDRLRELEHQYLHVSGQLVFQRCGQDCSPAEARHQLDGVDPVIRRSVWESRAAHMEKLRPDFEDMLDEVLALREQAARNADLPTWNHLRRARGEELPPQPQGVGLAALDQAGCPWDAGLCQPGPQHLFGEGEEALEELADALAYHAPRLALMLRRLLLHGLVERPRRAPLLDLDACFWLPGHGLPLLKLDLHTLDDQLELLLALVARARHAMASLAGMGNCLPGLVLWPRQEDLQAARSALEGMLGEWGATRAKTFRARIDALGHREQARSLAKEAWTWWAHEEPGAGRQQRRQRWLDLQLQLHPGLADKGWDEGLADGLFLHADFFLPDWAPPSRVMKREA